MSSRERESNLFLPFSSWISLDDQSPSQVPNLPPPITRNYLHASQASILIFSRRTRRSDKDSK